jgi:hypothetical protein
MSATVGLFPKEDLLTSRAQKSSETHTLIALSLFYVKEN